MMTIQGNLMFLISATPFSKVLDTCFKDFQGSTDLKQINFETLHSEWTAKMNFAYSSFARTTLALSSVRAISK